jgi:uncharacterized iron-regulated membrane protein
MTFGKIAGKIHLWLGLLTGTVVFFVGITGAACVFQSEIESLLNTGAGTKVPAQQSPFIQPSVLKNAAESALPEYSMAGVMYQTGNRAALAWVRNAGGHYGSAVINPYTAEVIHINKPGTFNFFEVMMYGHRTLWLPYETGHLIVSCSTLAFIILLITGLIRWLSKNRYALKRSFRLCRKPTTKWRTKNYDLHNIAGFHAFSVMLLLAITGCTFGLEWFAKGIYSIASGGKTMPKEAAVYSDTTQMNTAGLKTAEDVIWQKITAENPKFAHLYLTFADGNNPQSVIYVYVGNDKGKNCGDKYVFDKYTLKELRSSKSPDMAFAAQLQNIVYGIHTGQILGLPTKILAFGGSLIAASLPVTGFLIESV